MQPTSFINYMQKTVIPQKLVSNFIGKKYPNQTEQFRRENIWRVKTNDLLYNNYEFLDLLYTTLKIKNKKEVHWKFTL